MGAPAEAALSGKSSKVKLTIGSLLSSLNGVAQKYRDRRLLTRAFKSRQSVCAAIAIARSDVGFWGGRRRVFDEEFKPVAEHHGRGRAGRDILPQIALGQFGAQSRTPFGLCAFGE